jgi:heme/copper-type cytochrome/quinol oxidase subunit 1
MQEQIQLETPLFFALGFIVLFTLGGLTEYYVSKFWN